MSIPSLACPSHLCSSHHHLLLSPKYRVPSRASLRDAGEGLGVCAEIGDMQGEAGVGAKRWLGVCRSRLKDGSSMERSMAEC